MATLPPYLQYAYTRIRSLLRKAGFDNQVGDFSIMITNQNEKNLMLSIVSFEEVLDNTVKEAMPHIICNYLFELAKSYMSFYESCPILKDGINNSTKQSRLKLCSLVATTLKTGLDILGIEVMEKM